MPAIACTLFFKDAHLRAVRDAISACFEEFQDKAKPTLTWLYREDPPEGPDKLAYVVEKPLKKMLCGDAHAAELWDSDGGEFFTEQARPAKRASSRCRADEPYADDLSTVWLDARPAAIEAALDSIRAVHGQH